MNKKYDGIDATCIYSKFQHQQVTHNLRTKHQSMVDRPLRNNMGKPNFSQENQNQCFFFRTGQSQQGRQLVMVSFNIEGCISNSIYIQEVTDNFKPDIINIQER